MAKNPEFRKLLVLKEVADVLRISPRSVQRLVKDQNLRALRVGGSLRFHQDDLERFIERQRSN